MQIAAPTGGTFVVTASRCLQWLYERPAVVNVNICATEMADVVKDLKDAGLCSEVYYKELYLPAEEINGKDFLHCGSL